MLASPNVESYAATASDLRFAGSKSVRSRNIAIMIANKRSMNPGFAGIENELYYADNTLMLFGDAKAVLGDVVKALAGDATH